MLECVINISEGRDRARVDRIAGAAGADLLDVHVDPDHHRAVLTLLGEQAARAVTTAALAELDLPGHAGVHPRIGVVDVVPFVPLGDAEPRDAVTAREAFARWAVAEHGVPCYRYGPLGEPSGAGEAWTDWPSHRSLPAARARARAGERPDLGGAAPHPRFGAIAVGARPVLVAYNLWLAEDDLGLAKRVAAAVRGPHLRALGLPVAGRAQVSMNLIEPEVVGPAEAWDAVAALAPVVGAELVGLVPAAVLGRTDPARWSALDLDPDRTIEARSAPSPG